MSFQGNIFQEGVGEELDLDKPFLMVSQHPVTTEYGTGEMQISETLSAINMIGLPSIVLWPNSDAGSEDIARGIRKFREKKICKSIHFFKNLPTNVYIQLLRKTACLVGNSSSGIREGAFIGTPVVNIGSRQHMRERGSNVIDVEHESVQIYAAIKQQVNRGPFDSDPIYGNGSAGIQMAEILSKCPIRLQKTICF